MPPLPIKLGGTGGRTGDVSGLSVLPAGGTVARALSALFSDRINVKAFGAKGDGVLTGLIWTGTDDTAAITAARVYAMSSGKQLYFPAGTYLTRTGNPLGVDRGGSPAISRALSIVGDGKDLSRLVWFLDEVKGSLAGIVAAGAGYKVGDLVTVVGGTASTAMQIKVLAVDGNGAVTAASPSGTCNYSAMPAAGAATTGGSGSGFTVNVVAGGAAIATPYQGSAFNRLAGVTLRDFSVIGQGLQNPTQNTANGAMAVLLYSVNDPLIEGIGVDYSRCMSIVTRNSAGDRIMGCRVRYSSRDSINSTSAYAVIIGNQIYHGGDDGIAASSQPAEANAVPSREGIVIANNLLVDVQGIVVLGAASVSVVGNTLIRVKNRAINVSAGLNGEGSTPARIVNIVGNAITDIFVVAGDPISANAPTKYIIVGSTPAQAGSANGVPGFPVAGTGEFVSPYAYMAANGLVANAPTPPGLYVNVSQNVCGRTLPAAANSASNPPLFSSLGYGLTYGAAGPLDFPLIHSAVAEGVGVEVEQGIIQSLKINDNVFSGVLYALNVLAGARVVDGEFKRNIARDVTTYCVAFTPPVSSWQRWCFEDNTFDGDPYFQAAGRVTSGTAANGNPLFTGAWSGVTPFVFFQLPANSTVRRNTFRNWASLYDVLPATTRIENNKLYGDPRTLKGLGAYPILGEGWEAILEDSDPTSATFGQILNVAPQSATAQPSSGFYTAGLYVRNASPSGVNPVLGWVRLTTGSSHLTGVDWQAVYALGPTPAGSLLAGSASGAPTPVQLGSGLVAAGGVLSAASAPALQAASVNGAGTVGSITVIGGGAYFNNKPGVTIGAPPAGGVQAAAQVTNMGMSAFPIASAGENCVVGRFYRLLGGTFTTQASVQVTKVQKSDGTLSTTTGDVGAAVTIVGSNAGNYSVLPTNPVQVQWSGGSDGATMTLNPSWYILPGGVQVTVAGGPYATAPTVTFDAAGTGGTTATGTATLQNGLSLGSAGATGSAVTSLGAQIDGSGVRTALTTSGYTVPANTSLVRFTQSGTIASATVTLPTALADGQPIQFVQQGEGAVTALSFSPAVQGWTNGSQLNAGPGVGVRIRWDATAGSWYREQ